MSFCCPWFCNGAAKEEKKSAEEPLLQARLAGFKIDVLMHQTSKHGQVMPERVVDLAEEIKDTARRNGLHEIAARVDEITVRHPTHFQKIAASPAETGRPKDADEIKETPSARASMRARWMTPVDQTHPALSVVP